MKTFTDACTSQIEVSLTIEFTICQKTGDICQLFMSSSVNIMAVITYDFITVFIVYIYIVFSSFLFLISRLLSYVFWSDNRNVALICRIAEWKKTTKIDEETHVFLNILRNLYAAC